MSSSGVDRLRRGRVASLSEVHGCRAFVRARAREGRGRQKSVSFYYFIRNNKKIRGHGDKSRGVSR